MRNKRGSICSRLPYKMTLKDWVLHLVATPSIIVLANYFIWGTRYFTEGKIFIAATLLTCILGLLLTYTNMRSMFYARKKYPELSRTLQRLTLSFLLYAIMDIAGGFVLLGVFASLPFAGFAFTLHKAFNATLVMLVAAAVAALGYEFFYSFEKWKESIRANEALQRLQLQTELNALKSQVNPHFLFNSLNALSYLMTDDVQKAETYLGEMTQVYRYLLRNNSVELTELATELQFIRAYFSMLQTSSGTGVSLSVGVPDSYMNHLLPPLTLQLLVENAVKHNIAHREKPLQICIETNSKGWLVVSNNLQRKLGKVHSTHIGLNNIAAKYRLLNQPEVVIQETGGRFCVSLPLIAPADEVNSILQEPLSYPLAQP
ncbi:Histidine kinase [Cnuella takakiae]|uniref:Histidine kinase n=1 Tax=Cnuella takakiae TaxID=1302690 RepID=A0A1M5AZ29_9BACT|nr:sensor histidine kinase [Cnuella takakiae]OLY93276.1 hypothetical protein BUE76_16310 [Cnuella takakiae]SHF35460.1 Histidine kinase [Cnuella takakiae]